MPFTNHKEKLKRAEKFMDELSQRGLIYDSTDRNNLAALLADGKKIYLGIDPTADFLHLGHYVGLSMVKRFIRAGYPAVLLVGSLTARIGDPSFRSQSRKFNPDIDHNGAAIRDQLCSLFKEEMKADKGKSPMLEIVDNYVFHNSRLLSNVNLQKNPVDVLLEFLSEVCSNLKVSELVNRDFLRDRLMKGLTLQEFLYTCLQGWDFLYLHRQEGVAIQLGGSDQWGNMITGLRLITKVSAEEKNAEEYESDDLPYSPYDQDRLDEESKQCIHAGIITFPIVNDHRGNKFGKSDGNAICISGGDPNKNAYLVRQYFLNTSDDLVREYLLKFTNISVNEVEELMFQEDIKDVKAKLADAVCSDIFGRDISEHSDEVSKGMFNELAIRRSYDGLIEFAKYMPASHCSWTDNIQIFSLFKLLGFVNSRSEFNRLVNSGGIFVAQMLKEELSNVNCVLKEEHVV